MMTMPAALDLQMEFIMGSFILLTGFSGVAWWKAREAMVDLQRKYWLVDMESRYWGQDRRVRLFRLLTCSSAMRTLSTGLIMFLHISEFSEGQINVPYDWWFVSFIQRYPSLIFWSAFLDVAQVWVETSSLSVRDPRVQTTFKVTNVLGHAFFLGIFFLLLYCREFPLWDCIASTMTGILYLTLSAGSLFLSLRAISATSTSQRPPRVAIIHKLLGFALACPMLWLVRAAIDFLMTYRCVVLYPTVVPIKQSYGYVSVEVVASELLPTALLLAMFRASRSQRSSGVSKAESGLGAALIQEKN